MAILTAITEVFTEISTWIISAVAGIMPMFFAEGELTFLGVLAVASLAFSVVFLLIGLVQRFMHFGG